MSRDRAWRRAQRERVIAAGRRAYRAVTGDEPASVSDTRHPLDCGRSNCGMCHSEKRWPAPRPRMDPDELAFCRHCGRIAYQHDPHDRACPDDDDHARANAHENLDSFLAALHQ